jgi:hypothetical protein
MELFKADLHVHTVLSPCADLEMSPGNIISKAKDMGISILGVSDHNSTRQCRTMKELEAQEEDFFVLCGAEVTTKEEVHCLAYFETIEQLDEFDRYVYQRLLPVSNDPEKFGYQVVVDKNDMILDQPEKLLISATDIAIEELEKKVHDLDGIFIPAHVDRMRNGIIAQLGFIPLDLKYDALELSQFVSSNEFISQYPAYAEQHFIQSSDAHFLSEIGNATTTFSIDHLSFSEIKQALWNINGRGIKTGK